MKLVGCACGLLGGSGELLIAQVSSTQVALRNHRMRFAERQIIREDIMEQELGREFANEGFTPKKLAS